MVAAPSTEGAGGVLVSMPRLRGLVRVHEASIHVGTHVAIERQPEENTSASSPASTSGFVYQKFDLSDLMVSRSALCVLKMRFA